MKTGVIVKRRSYGMDVSFKVLHVLRHEGLALLQSVSGKRIFFADAPIEDLVAD
ncbi:MAG: sporulation peptidase YabG [Carboxydocellales bacterium]